MTTLREAAQMALDALDAYSWEQVNAARNALRAALADHIGDANKKAEPVALIQGADVLTSHPEKWGEDATEWTPLYPASPQRKSACCCGEPTTPGFVHRQDGPCYKAEPVAWMVYSLDGQSVCITDNPADFTDQHRALPLYTAPPQRKALTDEDIKKIVAKNVEGVTVAESVMFRMFARAIERAHGIGSEK